MDNGKLSKHAHIKVRVNSVGNDGQIESKIIDTVAGRVIFNEKMEWAGFRSRGPSNDIDALRVRGALARRSEFHFQAVVLVSNSGCTG